LIIFSSAIGFRTSGSRIRLDVGPAGRGERPYNSA
jgi:hypothetical protein